MGDVAGRGGLVQPALAAVDEFEALDRIGDETGLARQAGFLEAAVEQLPGGADERPAGKIFFVPRLLAGSIVFGGVGENRQLVESGKLDMFLCAAGCKRLSTKRNLVETLGR